MAITRNNTTRISRACSMILAPVCRFSGREMMHCDRKGSKKNGVPHKTGGFFFGRVVNIVQPRGDCECSVLIAGTTALTVMRPRAPMQPPQPGYCMWALHSRRAIHNPSQAVQWRGPTAFVHSTSRIILQRFIRSSAKSRSFLSRTSSRRSTVRVASRGPGST